MLAGLSQRNLNTFRTFWICVSRVQKIGLPSLLFLESTLESKTSLSFPPESWWLALRLSVEMAGRPPWAPTPRPPRPTLQEGGSGHNLNFVCHSDPWISLKKMRFLLTQSRFVPVAFHCILGHLRLATWSLHLGSSGSNVQGKIKCPKRPAC